MPNENNQRNALTAESRVADGAIPATEYSLDPVHPSRQRELAPRTTPETKAPKQVSRSKPNG
jgi:hypothetical protein